MQGIDRRVIGDIYVFTRMHPERYASLDQYRSESAEFRNLLKTLLPESWTVSDKPGVWCMALPPSHRVPDAGFKIHLSIEHDRARELLETVVPILVEESAAFKVLVDEPILDLGNSNLWGREGCGKFVTIYPADDEQFRRLMERLHEVTRRFTGPYILSDKRYKDNAILFYRYGAFNTASSVNVYGERISHLRTTDGRLIPDMRLPYFALPEGVVDPFPDTEKEEEEIVLKGRYKALSSLGSSSKGGVYLCSDLETNTDVVVKEARPLVNRSRHNPYDAVACLKNEHSILRRLEGTGVAPRPLDFFQEWEHSFLVMEHAQGGHLYSHLSRGGSFSISVKAHLSADDVRSFCAGFLTIARKIIGGLRAIHARGVALQDMSPRNILLDDAWERVTFIDFEAAYADEGDDKGMSISFYTPGFGTPKRVGEKPTFADDHRTLSRILGDILYPPTAFFSLAPHLRRPMLTQVAREKGVPEAFIQLIFGAEEQPEQLDELLDAAERSIASITAPEPPPPRRTDGDLRAIVDRIIAYIVDQMRGDEPLDLPTDYRRFVTNRLSAAYGAAGIALFLKRARGAVPDSFLDALVREASGIKNESFAPGLYIGGAGVAWTLLELGRQKEAEAVLDTAARSPLLHENADMFYGSAGFGLTNLFFFKQLGEEKYLKNAIDAFANIKPKLAEGERGYFYTNTGDIYYGLAHGAAGIGYFLLRLYQVTGQEEHLAYAKGLFDYEIANVQHQGEDVLVRHAASDQVTYPYMRIGSAGLGSLALRFHATLKDEEHLQLARKIAHSLASRYSLFPSNLYGMAGLGGFFVDMYQHTGEELYREEARRFVDRVMLFAIEKPTGLVFPGEELLRISTDYATGSAGTGMFIHRLVAGGGLPYLDF